MDPAVEVEVNDTQRHLQFDPADLVRLACIALAGLGRHRASVSIAVVDNATIHAVNRTHLGHDWPTDVISFPFSTPDDPVLTGELVVSAEMACDSAREIGVEPGDELALYVVHGLLHLCGFDDHDEADQESMRRLEGELLSRAGVTNPYAKQPVDTDQSGERRASSGPSGGDAGKRRLVGHQTEGRPWTG
jgi:probable rRNA maturation factor